MTNKNITPQKTYLKSLGKRVKDLTSTELKEYHSISNKYRYKTKYRDMLKEYYQANKGKIKAHDREYYVRNAASIKAKKKHLYQTDPEFRDASKKAVKRYQDQNKILRVWFVNAKSRLNVQGTFEEVVGCGIEAFQSHIESLFTEGMSWDNWGTGKGKTRWHIDHIASVKSGGSNHYTNLQPLWSYDNIIKRAID